MTVVSRALAERLWPDADPLGRRVRIAFPGEDATAEIVRVAGDARFVAPEEPPPRAMYVSYLQRPVPFLTLLIRSASPPSMLVGAVRRQVLLLDGR